jgi:histidinol-phosphatase (PHP family)
VKDLPVDYHIHTRRCGHAAGEMAEYVLEARGKGLKEIGFADHIPMYFLPLAERDPGIAMGEQELPDYVADVRALQERFAPFPVKLGIEADFTPGMEKELKAIISQYEFDYVLGSIHFLDGWGFDNSKYIEEYERRDISDIYTQYFNTLTQAAASGLFDSLAHPDLIKKFGFRPAGDISHLYEQAVKTIAGADICVEVNLAGLRVPAAEIYPALPFLQLCHKSRVPVTLGSDAHKPEQAGAGFEQAVRLLKDIGYNEVAVFSGRKRTYIKF